MKINSLNINSIIIAEIISDIIEIKSVQDALDIVANCNNLGSSIIILFEKNISPDFFNLRTGLAGEILQKFTNYQIKCAFIGDFAKYKSKNFRDFIYECNLQGFFIFVDSIDEAKKRLAQ